MTQASNNTSNITAAPLTVTGVTAANRVYDGTVTATLGGTAWSPGIGLDAVTVTGTGSGSFATKHAGTNKLGHGRPASSLTAATPATTASSSPPA